MKKLQPFSEWNMLFETVARIGVSATVEMNDLKGKDTPLLEIEVIITSLEVRSNQVVLGQLFCLLQHFLKYATDIYFYENRSSINNSNLEASNKERFHAAVTAILKKNSKTKKIRRTDTRPFRWERRASWSVLSSAGGIQHQKVGGIRRGIYLRVANEEGDRQGERGTFAQQGQIHEGHAEDYGQDTQQREVGEGWWIGHQHHPSHLRVEVAVGWSQSDDRLLPREAEGRFTEPIVKETFVPASVCSRGWTRPDVKVAGCRAELHQQ